MGERGGKNVLKHFEFALSMSFVFIISEFIHRVWRYQGGNPHNAARAHQFSGRAFFSHSLNFVNCLIFLLLVTKNKKKLLFNCRNSLETKKTSFNREHQTREGTSVRAKEMQKRKW